MYKMIINRKHSIPIDKIYAVEKKQWGSVWVRYVDEKGIDKISITRDAFRDFSVKLQIQRAANNTHTPLELRS